jgi:hypothetical protein
MNKRYGRMKAKSPVPFQDTGLLSVYIKAA